MEDVSIGVALEQLQAVLDECFIHVTKPWTYFTDNKPDAGLVGLLETISTEQASREIAGTSIASHGHHILFSLKEASAWIRGDHSHRDWKESWSVSSVNDEQWSELRKEIQKGYSDVREAIGSKAASSVQAIGGAIGVVAHMAFHLGAIRQKVTFLKQT